jgi:uncharacterized protein YjbI with pentapeptide repeats
MRSAGPKKSLNDAIAQELGREPAETALLPLRGCLLTSDGAGILTELMKTPPASVRVVRSACGLAQLAPGLGLRTLLVLAISGTQEDDELDCGEYLIFTAVDGWEFLRRQGGGLDLREADLQGAALPAANLAGADLSGANLRGADLQRADLRGAALAGADLSGCDLRRSSLGECDLSNANLARCDLRECFMGDAVVAGASLRGADLWAAFVPGTDFSTAYTEGCDLSRADTRLR